MRILHLSADYPDPVNPRKPRAIANLVALGGAAETRVISINRGGGLARLAFRDFADANGPEQRAVIYRGWPKGIGLRRDLLALADHLAADCEERGFRPDLIHAHKLTVEGIVGWRMAQRWGIPFVLSVQGNTDLRILAAKPLLRPLLRTVWQAAAVVFPYAPWAAEGVAARLGPRRGPIVLLPCPGPADALIAPVLHGPRLVTAFQLADHRRKNIARLAAAAALAAQDVPGLTLDILGDGPEEVRETLARMIAARAPGVVRLVGPVTHGGVQQRFNAASAFVLVSRAESFGMVFAEALLAGTPCLFPRGQAIEGYFREGDFTLSADPQDTRAMAAAIVRMVREQAEMKARLGRAQAAGELDFLRQATIGARYRAGLAEALKKSIDRPETISYLLDS